ncbi:MAG: phosphomethylpyrimidine synthase ThiC, partial [Gammaproteobacteria bacterium]
MSADPTDLLKQTARLSEEVTRPFMNSRKIIRTGSRGDIRVAMREVDQTATPAEGGSVANPPITLYDT